MSTTNHHCIIIIGDDSDLKKVKKIAREIFYPKMVSNIIKSQVNEVRSLYIAPDGSGDGWDTSNEYDTMRERFYSRVKSGKFFVDIAEVEMHENGNFKVRNVRRD